MAGGSLTSNATLFWRDIADSREDTFVIFGGIENSLVIHSVDTVIEFSSPLNESWITRSETLSRPKHGMFLIDVDSSLYYT